MLSELGKALQKLRSDNNELLKNMADKLNISAVELSAIEHGKAIMSKDTFATLIIKYDLGSDYGESLVKLFKESQLIKPEYYFYNGRRFNIERNMKNYKRIYEEGLRDGYTEEELSTPYLDRLHKKTKSSRIYRFISLAYTLGWLRGIAYTDEGYTKISCGGGIETMFTKPSPIKNDIEESKIDG